MAKVQVVEMACQARWVKMKPRLQIAQADPAGPKSFHRYAQALRPWLAAQGVHVKPAAQTQQAHVFWNPYGGWGEPAVLPPEAKQPLVVTFHGAAGWSKPLRRVQGQQPPLESVQWAAAQRTRWEGVLRSARAILVPSDYGKTELLGLFALDEARLHVIPLGHDPRIFQPLGPKADGVGFLHVSAGGPVKRVGLILNAYARLQQPKPSLTLVLPPDRWPASLPAGVKLLAPVDDDAQLAALYRGAIALLQPSAWETFGLPAVEAAACGTPPIVSANTAPKQIWQEHALMIHSDEPEELAAAMYAMLDAPTLAHWRGLAIEHARKLTWEACAARTAKIFHSVNDRRGIWRFAPWRHGT